MSNDTFLKLCRLYREGKEARMETFKAEGQTIFADIKTNDEGHLCFRLGTPPPNYTEIQPVIVTDGNHYYEINTTGNPLLERFSAMVLNEIGIKF